MTDISAISSALPATGATASTTDAMADQLGADVFLELLVAQLKYQDPTAPSDGTEFLAQTAQFTMVEKLTQLAESAEAAAVVDRNLAAATMVGRQVEFLRLDGTTGAGMVEAARLGSSGPVLTIGGEEVPFETVSTVLAPTPAPETAPSAEAPEATDAASSEEIATDESRTDPSRPVPTTTHETTDAESTDAGDGVSTTTGDGAAAA